MRTLKKSVAFILVFTLMMVIAILPASAASESGIINGVEVTGWEFEGSHWMILSFEVDFAPGTEQYVTHGYGWITGPGLDYPEHTTNWNTSDFQVQFSPDSLIVGEWYTLTIEAFDSAYYLGSGFAHFEYTGESGGFLALG